MGGPIGFPTDSAHRLATVGAVLPGQDTDACVVGQPLLAGRIGADIRRRVRIILGGASNGHRVLLGLSSELCASFRRLRTNSIHQRTGL